MSKSKRFNPPKSNPSFFPESLRKRLSDDLQLQGMADRTVKAYVRAVRQLAEFLKRSPEEVCDDHIREYFLHLKNDRRFANGSLRVSLAGFGSSIAIPVGENFPRSIYSGYRASTPCLK
ncbi:hypothetical protein LF1_56530 [Rubripirellula obstinata]|uniref:Integrase SAM-like N-terminal domain-containing protein n=1 Tax=Rubripirellula obstinata TaxID=406547 RepID=A0A5B1CA47_9BACT|nr:site-specific integrase [Rubripirellula obstinata]KAA1257091.1 hypothetical protein LF1_56530 [Rubripirellula obstinata]